GRIMRPFRKPVDGLPDYLETLPHFFLSDHKPVVGVSIHAHRDNKVEVLVRAVGVHDANVVVNASSPEVGTGEAIVEGTFRGNWASADSAVHEDAVSLDQLLEFFQRFWEFLEKLFNLCPGCRCEITFEATDPANVCC